MSNGAFQPLPQNGKFAIGTVDRAQQITVEAQYNPKELQIDSPIGWKEHETIGAQSVAGKKMQFTGMGAETIKVELLFDAYELDDDSVVEKISQLKAMASVEQPNGKKNQRPSFCVATWGTQAPFRCVIESMSVKYTMFSQDGTPLRAVVTLGLKSGVRDLAIDKASGFGAKNNEFEAASMAKLEKQRQAMQKQRVGEIDVRRRAHDEELARQRDLLKQQAEADRKARERVELNSQLE